MCSTERMGLFGASPETFVVYSTYYSVRKRDGTRSTGFPSAVCVRDGEDIDDLLARRNIGEHRTDRKQHVAASEDEGPHWFSDHLRRQGAGTLDDVHTATFLAFLAISSGVADLDDTLADYGFVHNLAHHASFNHPGFKGTVDLIRHVESRIPGLWMPGI